MADRDEMALSYLLPPSLSFWHWQDRGDAVAWIDGGTIAFREALILVLERLAPRGLPPLGCVLLLLAACRDNWREGRRETGRIDGIPLPLTVPRQQERERTQIARVVAALDGIHMFDRKYRTNIEMVAVMAELVFENAAVRTTTETSQTVIAALRAGIIADVSDHHAMRAEPQPSFDSEMKILLDGLPLVTEEAIEARLRRGVEQDLAPVPLDLPPAERVRRLIDDLQTDVELYGVARLARKLLAALSVLRPVSAPDELALGGVSDITNRGPLDRLLLSELAHDDLTLATRIAMGEALYLRREAPPSDPPAVRSILIDAGLRLWGIPRLYAAAVGMAFSAVDRAVDISAFRASCNKLVPVDLSTRAGLLAHLESLEPELHPGAALAPFRARLDETDETLEPILITHADTLDDADFRQSLAASRFDVLWIASLDRTGSFALHSFTPSGRKLLREARFSLDDILEPPKQLAAPVVDRSKQVELPLIYDVKPFPLFLSYRADIDRCWKYVLADGEAKGAIGMTHDRQLLFWSDPKRGAEVLADRVPANAVYWAENLDGGNRYRAVVGPKYGGRLFVLDVDIAKRSVVSFPIEGIYQDVRGVYGRNSALFVVERLFVHVHESASGKWLEKLHIDNDMYWLGGRLVKGIPGNCVYAMTFDGVAGRFEKIAENVTTGNSFTLNPTPSAPDKNNSKCPEFTNTYFYTFVGHNCEDGPWGVSGGGRILNLSTGEPFSLDIGLIDPRLEAVSKDHERLLFRGSEPKSKKTAQVLVDLGRKKVVPFYRPSVKFNTPDESLNIAFGEPRSLVDSWLPKFARPSGLPRHFFAAQIDRDNIWLRSRSGAWWILSDLRPTLDPTGPGDIGCVVKFQRLNRKRREIDIRVATWNDGSRLFIDSRDLLHFVSSDPTIPQVSMVVNDPHSSGWCSDGRMWGDPFFIGDRATSSAPEIAQTVVRRFARWVSGC